MNQQGWSSRKQVFDEQILEQLNDFRTENLYDDRYKNLWIQLAQKVSRMNITQNDLSSMSFEQFNALHKIMSVTLENLSITNEKSADKIKILRKKEGQLNQNLEKLDEISTYNCDKQKKIKEELRKMNAQLNH